jgi:hypothetical protein
MVYTRHGQTVPCGPHAARQTFFAALEFRGVQIFCKNAIFEKKFDFLSQNMTFLKNIFWNLLFFSQICKEISKKNLTPLPPGMNLRPPKHYKLLKMAVD